MKSTERLKKVFIVIGTVLALVIIILTIIASIRLYHERVEQYNEEDYATIESVINPYINHNIANFSNIDEVNLEYEKSTGITKIVGKYNQASITTCINKDGNVISKTRNYNSIEECKKISKGMIAWAGFLVVFFLLFMEVILLIGIYCIIHLVFYSNK